MLKTAVERTAGLSHWKRLGKIKLGVKVKSQRLRCQEKNQSHVHNDECFWHFPKDVNYFVIPDEHKAKLGAEPRLLRIMLAFPTLEQNFDVRAAVYRSNGSKFCSTNDDVKAMRIGEATVQNPKKGQAGQPDTLKKTVYNEISCPALECEFRKKGECKERGQFEFIIPEVYPAVGTFFLKIGSKVSTSQILGTLKMIEYFCQSRPNGMQGIRLTLERELVVFNVDTKGDGTLTRVEKYIPKLSIDIANLIQSDQALLMPAVGQQFLIPEKATSADVEDELDDDDRGAGAPRIIDQHS